MKASRASSWGVAEALTRIGRPRYLTQHLGIDAAVVSRPSGWLHASQGMYYLKHGRAPDQAVEFITIDHVLKRARRVEQTGRYGAPHGCTVAEHRHQGHDTRPSGYQQERATHMGFPDEVAPDGAAQLQLVTGAELT